MLNYGDILYRYVLRNGEIHVQEGEVIKYKDRYMCIHFSNGGNVLIPKQFGVIQHGVTIWLTERNDELVRKIYIEHKEDKISNLLKNIDKEKEEIEKLKEGL